MTKRQALRIAHGVAYRFVQSALDVGDDSALYSEADQLKIENALDDICQRHFERSNLFDPDQAADPRRARLSAP